MSNTFDRQRDALPARYTGGFRLQEIRQRELEREAARRWPLLAAIDDYLWNNHMRRHAFERATGFGDEAEGATHAAGQSVVAMAGGQPWGTSR